MGMGIRSRILRAIELYKLRRYQSSLTREIKIAYPSIVSDLDIHANRFHTDKGGGMHAGEKFPWPCHTYVDLYHLLFTLSRVSTQRLFEFGLGSNDESIPNAMTANAKPGASLRLWREFFPNAQIYGADIDRSILFSDERITTYYCNQLESASLVQMWAQVGEQDFDIIIDDGLHTFDAGINTFEMSIRYLSKDGLYIIEDVSTSIMLRYMEWFHRFPQYSALFVAMSDSSLKPIDNNVIVIRRNETPLAKKHRGS